MDLSSPGVSRETYREAYGSFYLWLPLTYLDESEFLRQTDRRVRLSRLPYRILKARHPDMVATADPAVYAVVTDALLLDFGKQVARRDSAIAQLSGSRILLALIAYKDRFGGYPNDLDQLRRRLGWQIPLDPFSGKDFMYRRHGKGLILYSVGEDLKDDGARVVARKDYTADIPISAAEGRRATATVPVPTAPGLPAAPQTATAVPHADPCLPPGIAAPAPPPPVTEVQRDPDVYRRAGGYYRTVHYKSPEYADIVWQMDR